MSGTRNNMTNILIISDGYPSAGLPYSAFIATLAEEMTRQGMNVQVLAPQSLTKHWLRHVPLAPRHFTQAVDGRTIDIYRPYSITAGDGRFGFITRLFNRLVTTRTAKRLHKPDVVYAHFWLNALMVIPFVKATQLPLVVATGEHRRMQRVQTGSHLHGLHLVNGLAGGIEGTAKIQRRTTRIGTDPRSAFGQAPRT